MGPETREQTKGASRRVQIPAYSWGQGCLICHHEGLLEARPCVAKEQNKPEEQRFVAIPR